LLSEVMVFLQSFKKLLLAAVLLAAVLTAGCAAGTSGPPDLTGREDAGETTEAVPATQNETRQAGLPPEEKEATVKQPAAAEEPGGTPVQELPVRQAKPLVIISENPVFADTGQLLDELDKELETLFDLLETMDDIPEDELSF